MKYIKNFDESNESFKHVIIGSLLLLSSLSKLYAQDDFQYLASCMKKQESKPSLYLENKIDSLRKYMETEIDNSNYKYKKELKDSINTIPIFSVDLTKLKNGDGTAEGCQVLFNNKDMHGNVIFISDNIKNENISSSILHEIYHFITTYEKLDFNYFLDKNALTNNNVLLNKVSLIFEGKLYSQLTNKKGIDDLFNNFFLREKDYLTKNDEVVVRILGMKNWLISKGRIKKMSDNLNESDLQYIITNMRKEKILDRDFIEIFPFLNFETLFNVKY